MDSEDDDDGLTPPRRDRVTDSQRAAHFADYPPGTPPVRELVPTPHNSFEVELGRRVTALEADMMSLLASRRMWRWISGLGIPVLCAAMIGMATYSADKISSSAREAGATQAKIEGLEKLVDTLLRKVTVTVPPKGVGVVAVGHP